MYKAYINPKPGKRKSEHGHWPPGGLQSLLSPHKCTEYNKIYQHNYALDKSKFFLKKYALDKIRSPERAYIAKSQLTMTMFQSINTNVTQIA